MNEIIDMRNREITRHAIVNLKHYAAKGRKLTFDELLNMMLEAKATCYFASFDRAVRLMAAADGGRRLPASHPETARMWTDMYADLQRLRLRHPASSLQALVMKLLQGSAGSPRYYVSPIVMTRILRPIYNLYCYENHDFFRHSA